MKGKKMRKILSVFLAAAMVASASLGNMSLVFAGGDTMPPRPGEQGYFGNNQPTYAHWRVNDVLEWEPGDDQYSEFMRAKVPLQERNEAFNATQANPLLTQEVECLSLAGDYGNQFIRPPLYNDKFAQYLHQFWQYEDYYAEWHGVVTAPTPYELMDMEAGWWERAYEFGAIAMPNPDYTNAAHKNGVKSLGGMFFPRTEHTNQVLFTDENGRYPIADKMVEIAKYYGFDGYFINAEENLPASYMPMYEEFCRQITEQGIYVQSYASCLYGQNNQSSWGRIDYSNKDATGFSNWVKGTDDETVAANSLYMNPGPSKAQVDGSVNIMNSLGLDARKTVFQTLEAGQTGFSGVRGSLNNLLDENLVPRTGIATLGSETAWGHLDEQVFGHTGNNSYSENRRGDSDYQKYVIARERTWWSGASNQPHYANSSDYVMKGVTLFDKPTTDYTEEERAELLRQILNADTNPYETANDPTRGESDGVSPVHGEYQSWPGMAAFISERSVIDGTDFTTNFNTGHGMQYFVNGEVSNDNEWANINLQDVTPTWQWWYETADGSEYTLDFDFDYGEKYNPAFELNQIGGYDGGSSLVAKGPLSVEHLLRLFKTKLDINENSKFDITYYKSTGDDASEMKVALIFEENPNEIVYLPIAGSGKQSTEWTKASLDLSDYAGKTLAAFGLAFDPNETAIADYQMNIGEISINDDQAVPDAPTGLKIDKAFNSTETYISWDLADYSDVEQYNVYAEYEDGTEVYLGGAYNDMYYIKDLYTKEGKVTIKVTAENANGVESAPATIVRDLDAAPSELKAEAKEGSIDVSWTNGTADYTSIRAEMTFANNPYDHEGERYTATFEKGATTGTVPVPVTDGSNYYLRLSYLDAEGKEVVYTDISGQLVDNFCEPYEGIVYQHPLGKGWTIDSPKVYDWWHLTAWDSNGNVLKNNVTRGVDDLTGLSLQGESGYIEVQLEDFAGNKSERIAVPYGTPPTVDGVTVTAVGDTVEKYGTMQFTAEVTGENDPPQTVSWSVEGGVAGTTIDSNGLLTVAGDETAQTLTVTATSTLDDTKSGSAAVAVSQEPASISGIEITPKDLLGYKGGEIEFTAEVTGVNCPRTVTWSVEGGKSADTAIDENGVLTIGADESSIALTVKAVSTFDSSITAETSVGVGERADNLMIGATVLGVSNEVNGAAELAFDGNEETKWCDNNQRTGWLAVDLGGTYTVDHWKTIHGERTDGDPGFNTAKFALEVLKNPDATEAELSDPAYLANNDNWTEVEFVDNSQDMAMVVDHKLETPVTGRYFRLRIDQSTTNQWTACRIHEWEMYNDQAGEIELADKTLLQKTYDYAETLSTEGVVESAAEFFENAKANAKKVLDKKYVTQEEVNAAWDQLLEGIWGLGLVQGDKTNLNMLIERAEGMVENADKYVQDENWDALLSALEAAKAVAGDGDAMEGDIQPAADALLNAILAQRYNADKSILEEIINQANEIDTSLYTAESVQAFTAALKSANAILADESLSEDEQAAVDEAVATLSSAMDNLEKLSSDNGNTGSGDDNKDDNTSDKDDTSSKDDPNKGPISKNPATGDNNLIALGALAVLLPSAGAFVVIRRKSRA